MLEYHVPVRSNSGQVILVRLSTALYTPAFFPHRTDCLANGPRVHRRSDATDTELVRQFKRGDEAAFSQLVQRHQDRIFRLAAVSLYDEQLAADAAQEVFIRAYRGLRGFRFTAVPFTWLYRTTKNVCHEFNRQRRELPTQPDEQATDASPESLMEDLDTARSVRSLVAALPPRQREAVVLRVFEEMPVRETAALMGCREGTVKALLHKATLTLRHGVASEGSIDG